MLRSVQFFLWLVSAIILQVSILPIYLEESFKPNLIIILVCFLALREDASLYRCSSPIFSDLFRGFSAVFISDFPAYQVC